MYTNPVKSNQLGKLSSVPNIITFAKELVESIFLPFHIKCSVIQPLGSLTMAMPLS